MLTGWGRRCTCTSLANGVDAERIIGLWIDFYNEMGPLGRGGVAGCREGWGEGGMSNPGPGHPSGAGHRRIHPSGRLDTDGGRAATSPQAGSTACDPTAPRTSSARRWGLHFTSRNEVPRGRLTPVGIRLGFALGRSNEVGPPEV